MMNLCDNSLLQGTTTPTADKIGGHSGKPAVHLKDNQSCGRTHHQVEVGPYNSAWFNKFGEHMAANMGWMNVHGHSVIIISPQPHYPAPCCWAPGHFPHNFNHNLFIGEIFKLGVFMSQMKCMGSSIVLTPEDICEREEWIAPRGILSRAMVYQTNKRHKFVGESVRRAVAWTNLDKSAPEEESSGSIPSEIPFQTWVRSFQTTCGYKIPVPMEGAKRTYPANTCMHQ